MIAKDHHNITQKKPEENERKLWKATRVKEIYQEMKARVCQQPADQPIRHLLALSKFAHLVIYFTELLMPEHGSSTFEKRKGRTLGLITLGTPFRFFEHPMRIQDKPFVSQL